MRLSHENPREPKLWARMLSGARWTLFLRLFTRSLGVISTLFVARLLPHSEIGAFGVVLIADAGLQAITAWGFTAALVQMKRDPGPYLDTAWTVQIVRVLVVYAVEFALAPHWCAFFRVPEATTALRVLGFCHVVLGFHSISTSLLMRDLRFDRLFYNYAVEAFVHAGVTISLSFWLRNIWGPVLGLLAGFTTRVIVSYLVSPVRARFGFDLAKAREMFRYTKWLTGYALADFAIETSDKAVTGRILGTESLAQYRMAYQLATEGPVSIQWIVTRVAFPAFSRIQADRSHVIANLRAILGLVAAIMLPLTAGLVLLGPVLLPILLGPGWTPAILPLQILVCAAMLRAIIDTAPPVLRALGYTRADFVLKLIQLVTLLGVLYPAARLYGTTGAACAVVLAAVLTMPAWAVALRSALRLAWRDLLFPFVSPLTAALLALGVGTVLPQSRAPWLTLVTHSLAFLAIYGATSWILLRKLPASGVGVMLREMKK